MNKLKLREYRKRAGMTGEDVAHQLGVSQPTVIRHEHNPSSVNIPRLYQYAEIYGCAAADLLSDSDDEALRDHELLSAILAKVAETMKKNRLDLKPEEFADVVTYIHERMTQVSGPERRDRLDVIVDEIMHMARRESRLFARWRR